MKRAILIFLTELVVVSAVTLLLIVVEPHYSQGTAYALPDRMSWGLQEGGKSTGFIMAWRNDHFTYYGPKIIPGNFYNTIYVDFYWRFSFRGINVITFVWGG